MDKKTVFIIMALVTGVIILGGLYISTSFRLQGTLNDSRAIQRINRQLIQSNDFLGDQLNSIGLTIDRLNEDKRDLRETNNELREQLGYTQATVDELTRTGKETERIVRELRGQNSRFGEILERYKMADPGL